MLASAAGVNSVHKRNSCRTNSDDEDDEDEEDYMSNQDGGE